MLSFSRHEKAKKKSVYLPLLGDTHEAGLLAEAANAKESGLERRGGGGSPDGLLEPLDPVLSEADTLLNFK